MNPNKNKYVLLTCKSNNSEKIPLTSLHNIDLDIDDEDVVDNNISNHKKYNSDIYLLNMKDDNIRPLAKNIEQFNWSGNIINILLN